MCLTLYVKAWPTRWRAVVSLYLLVCISLNSMIILGLNISDDIATKLCPVDRGRSLIGASMHEPS